MPQVTLDERKRIAAERMAERQRRTTRIRKRVLAASASTFALAWGVIFVQLVSGNDPALAHKATTATSTASATPASSSSSSGTASSASSSSSSANTSPVTTSQS